MCWERTWGHRAGNMEEGVCGEFQPRRNLCLNPGQERGPRLQERKVTQGDWPTRPGVQVVGDKICAWEINRTRSWKFLINQMKEFALVPKNTGESCLFCCVPVFSPVFNWAPTPGPCFLPVPRGSSFTCLEMYYPRVQVQAQNSWDG